VNLFDALFHWIYALLNLLSLLYGSYVNHHISFSRWML